MGRKTLAKKKRLARANRQNKRLPLFVAVRTKRRIQSSIKRRTWRTSKLRIREE